MPARRVSPAGLENGFHKTRFFSFKKPKKTPKVQNLGFLGFFLFWSHFIHIILNFTYFNRDLWVLLYFTENHGRIHRRGRGDASPPDFGQGGTPMQMSPHFWAQISHKTPALWLSVLSNCMLVMLCQNLMPYIQLPHRPAPACVMSNQILNPLCHCHSRLAVYRYQCC